MVSTSVQIWNTLGLSQPSLSAEWLKTNETSLSASLSSGKEMSVSFFCMMSSKAPASSAVPAAPLESLNLPFLSLAKYPWCTAWGSRTSGAPTAS